MQIVHTQHIYIYIYIFFVKKVKNSEWRNWEWRGMAAPNFESNQGEKAQEVWTSANTLIAASISQNYNLNQSHWR